MTEVSKFSGSPLQAVPCDICGSSKDRTFLTLPDMLMKTSEHLYRLAECRSCGLIYLNPRPYSWDIPRYYPESYAPFTRQKLSSRARTWLHSRSVNELSHLVGSPNRVLDVGCGTGELLQAIRNGGNTNLTGVEPSRQAASIAIEQRGLDVRVGTLEQQQFPDASVDTVLLSHVLEHLPSPSNTMKEIERILKPGGAVVIWVPNARSFAARYLGRFWMGWDVPRHLYAFTPGSLYRLLELTELQAGEILHERHAIEWAWGLRLLVQEKLHSHRLNSILATLHPVTALLLTPLGVLSAGFRRSGRIRMICHKPIDLVG
jgi:SAM-dependent methyltransferase